MLLCIRESSLLLNTMDRYFQFTQVDPTMSFSLIMGSPGEKSTQNLDLDLI